MVVNKIVCVATDRLEDCALPRGFGPAAHARVLDRVTLENRWNSFPDPVGTSGKVPEGFVFEET